MEAKAQKDTTRQKRIIQEVISQQKTWQTKVYFLNKGKPMKIKESVIQQGTTLIIEVAWNPQLIKKVVFDTVVYRPTPQEIKDSKYTFTIKPKKKTTTYDYKIYDHDDKELLISRKITVTDKNGVEIKEEELKNYQERK